MYIMTLLTLRFSESSGYLIFCYKLPLLMTNVCNKNSYSIKIGFNMQENDIIWGVEFYSSVVWISSMSLLSYNKHVNISVTQKNTKNTMMNILHANYV